MKEEKTKTGKPKARRRRYDSAWKTVIRFLLKQFLEFFFPVIHDAIDFDKEVTFLDKELKEINPNSNMGDREADALVKVHLKDGTTQYICLVAHIEVQGDLRSDLMERIFVYFYRIFDKEKGGCWICIHE